LLLHLLLLRLFLLHLLLLLLLLLLRLLPLLLLPLLLLLRVHREEVEGVLIRQWALQIHACKARAAQQHNP
jgi:hypothetical protein